MDVFVLLLLSLFAGVLTSIVSASVLVASVPRDARFAHVLFAKGSAPLYRGIRSLRARYLLPWTSVPDLSECGAVASTALRLARAGAVVAGAALVGLGVSGLFGSS